MYVDGIGDEVFSFFFTLLAVLIIYFGWKSTRVRDRPHNLNLIIFENRQPTASSSTGGGLQRSESQHSNRTETEEIVNNVIEELENDITEFVSASSVGDESTVDGTSVEEERAEESILQRMDQADGDIGPEMPNEVKEQPKAGVEKEMTIKLKYINDDMKLVTGRASEGIGDFKKRTFSVELAAQKLIKLVFNGQVLEPEGKTLKECGLFDQCVVHALVLNRRSNEGPSDTSTHTTDNMSAGTFATPSGPSDPSGRPCIYIGVALLCSSLLIMWTARYQYASYFTINSTIGLVLMSIVFAALIPLLILMERGVQG